MQPIPECRIRVWKKEWRQTVGSQTSLMTGTRRIANRDEQKARERWRMKTGEWGENREEEEANRLMGEPAEANDGEQCVSVY